MQAIEVKVVEIDGLVPVAAPRVAEERAPARDWRQWQGRVMKLDAKWWPLWAALGIVAIFLILTVGVVLGMIYLVFAILRAIGRSLFG